MTYHSEYFDVELTFSLNSTCVITSMTLPFRPMVGDVIMDKSHNYEIIRVAYIRPKTTGAGSEFSGFLCQIKSLDMRCGESDGN